MKSARWTDARARFEKGQVHMTAAMAKFPSARRYASPVPDLGRIVVPEEPWEAGTHAGKLIAFNDPSRHALTVRAKAFIFEDELSRRLQEEIERVAPSQASVLIQGETGTGKELVARHIHELSGVAGPFIAVNCGAIPESLVEAELFGHVAGAFTGANEERQGWFEAANGGTLFLDEIGDLPLSTQVKLLRVLQEREVVRLGARKSVPIDVRLVTATNVDLQRAVTAGHFRIDLFYRINVASLQLPPLRDRPDDIAPLARYFAAIFAQRLSVDVPEIPQQTFMALRRYAWPGNIRELENVIHHALLVCRDGVLRPSDLRFVGVCAPGTNHSQCPSPPEDALDRALERLISSDRESIHEHVEARLLQIAFQKSGMNQVRTAQALGISRNVLRTMLKRHGMIL
jgi:sigma-54 dependent transcriptional regulator